MNVADYILKELVADIESNIAQSGILFHVFSRAKKSESIKLKIQIKGDKYKADGEKMQDFLGMRITLYFSDDVEIIHEYLKNKDNYISETVDKFTDNKFCPQRLNIIQKLPDKYIDDFHQYIKENCSEYAHIIDDTYEIQIRTILSEGWHEVEHDLRYKCKDEWINYGDESRLLNGIYASLETSEWSLLSIFDKISYKCYKSHQWNSMLRNKMRLHFKDNSLSTNIIQCLDSQNDIAKEIFKTDRSTVLQKMLQCRFSLPITYDTIIHVINFLFIHNKQINSFCDPYIVSVFKTYWK